LPPDPQDKSNHLADVFQTFGQMMRFGRSVVYSKSVGFETNQPRNHPFSRSNGLPNFPGGHGFANAFGDFQAGPPSMADALKGSL
jgi:hypothetical protein